MRQQLAAADPDAAPNDIEVELAMQLTERQAPCGPPRETAENGHKQKE